MHNLRAHIERLEKECRDEQEHVFVPLPHEPDRTMRLPRRFVEFLVMKGQEHAASGGYYNRTDEQWVECQG
jgi:hypothetical protein